MTFVAVKFIGVILLLAAAPKLLKPHRFRQSIKQLDLIPRSAAAPLVAIVPVSEVVVGLMLLCSVWVAAAALVAAVMMLSFAVVLAGNVIRGHRVVACGCFGGSTRHVGWSSVFSNVLLTVIACAVALSVSRSGGAMVGANPPTPVTDTLAWIALSCVGVYAAFVYRSVTELRELMTVGSYRIGQTFDMA